MPTLGDVARAVHLQLPTVDYLLALHWTQQAYQDLADRYPWTFLRRQSEIIIAAQRTLAAVGVTQGNAVVTSAALFLAADAGRQFRVGTFPTYTVDTFTNTSSITLDRPYAGVTNAAAAATIVDQYTVMPADFGAFLTTRHPDSQRVVPWWFDQELLDFKDPHRTSTGSSPRILVAQAPSQRTATIGRVRYEIWPLVNVAAQIPYLYRQAAQKLAVTTDLQGVLATRDDVLEIGALYRASRYPGTPDHKNPAFSLGNAKIYRDEWNDAIARLGLRDDDQTVQSVAQVPWEQFNAMGLALDDDLLRSSDASVDSFF